MKSRSAIALVPLAVGLLVGCAENGSLTTGSLNPSVVDPKQVAETKQACATLAAQIEGLNNEGISEKVEKAAAKKYKMKTADLAKASELNKANADFQAKCSNYPAETIAAAPKPGEGEAKAEAEAKGDTDKSTKTAAKPPVPPRKSITAAEAEAAKQQAANRQQAQVSAEVEAAPAKPAPEAETKTVASAEPETTHTSMESSSSIREQPFAAPRMSAAPMSTVTTTGTP